MRHLQQETVAVALGFLTILVVGYLLYRPRVQKSQRYQAMVVPLANIMDVGFIRIQALLAAALARCKSNWRAVAGFIGVGLIMGAVMVFGLPL